MTLTSRLACFVPAAFLLLLLCSGCGSDEEATRPPETEPGAPSAFVPIPDTSATAQDAPSGGAPSGFENGNATGGATSSPGSGTGGGAGGARDGARRGAASAGAAPASGGSSNTATGVLQENFTGTAGETASDHAGTGAGTLSAVRAARQGNFDRIVFEFQDVLPAYHVGYIDRPVRTCRAGTVVDLPGDGYLEVRFNPSSARTDSMRLAVQNRRRITDLPILKEHALVCNEADEVTWVLGLSSPNRYRAFALENPPRLVVDIKH